MTILRHIARLVNPRTGGHSPFERYYSRLVLANAGAAGLPSAREARQDLRALRALHAGYPAR
ncbi:MAG: hypothetical protein M3Q65_09280 [Chloroflexota bacterium]|nr:hypothetical protein [Chloroflexota bacterium]